MSEISLLLLRSSLVVPDFEIMKTAKQKFITLATIIVLLNGIMLVSCQIKKDKNVGGIEKLLRKYLNEAQYSAVVSGLFGGCTGSCARFNDINTL